MKPSDLDWDYLRQGLLLPLALALAGMVALGVSAWHRAGIGSDLELRQQQLDALDQQRSDLSVRLQARERYGRRFRELQQAGIAGPEQRLAWAQAFRDGAAALRLPYLRYSAAPQGPYEKPWLAQVGAAPVMATVVELQAGLVHELDLLRLIARLRQAPGMFDVAGCSLERVESGTAPEPDKANVTGNCRLHWFSLPSQADLLAAAEAGS